VIAKVTSGSPIDDVSQTLRLGDAPKFLEELRLTVIAPVRWIADEVGIIHLRRMDDAQASA